MMIVDCTVQIGECRVVICRSPTDLQSQMVSLCNLQSIGHD
jgi:hypothetical protein